MERLVNLYFNFTLPYLPIWKSNLNFPEILLPPPLLIEKNFQPVGGGYKKYLKSIKHFPKTELKVV